MLLRPAADGDRDRWQAFLASCRWGDFLHDWAWGEVARYDGEPQRRFVVESATELLALCAAQVRRTLLGRTVWYVPHGPVLDYADARAAEIVRTLADGLTRAARAERGILVILEPRLEAGAPGLAALRDGRLRPAAAWMQVRDTRIVDLSLGDDELLARFEKDTRYAVRRAEREGVVVVCRADATDTSAADSLYELMVETQRRAGFPMPARERIRTAWRALGGAGRAVILEARHAGRLMATGMLVLEGDRSFYLFAGSRREKPGETKVYASYALQWSMMRLAREMGSRSHDLWGIAPPDAGLEHPWHGVGLFKKGFDGDVVRWAGTWEIHVDPMLVAVRRAAAGLKRRVRRASPGVA